MPKISHAASNMTNGVGAAAILSAGIGCFVFAALAFAADKLTSVKLALSFYKPTGPLSGVSTLGVLAWLVTWAFFEWRWQSVNVSLRSVCTFALVLLGVAFLLTFPPVVDFL
jgi:hypothetical protein